MTVRAGRAQLRALVGKVLDGRYEIRSLLGEGGMGSVFGGIQVSLDRPVAIKVLRPEVARSEEVMRRFAREARLTARLSHPNTIKLFDYGRTASGLVYLVMERLGGRELADLLRTEGPLPVHRALGITLQITRALRAGHRLGIVHRDLKPSNIRVTVDDDDGGDHATVLDFGFAKKLDDGVSQRLTAYGTVLGTPAYMAPEQAEGQPVSPACDIYAVGVVLFEMLTGRVPFADKSLLTVMMAHRTKPPPTLAEVRPELAAATDIQELLSGLLRKGPEERPDADGLIARLEALLQVTAPPAAAGTSRIRIDSADESEGTAFVAAIDDVTLDGEGPAVHRAATRTSSRQPRPGAAARRPPSANSSPVPSPSRTSPPATGRSKVRRSPSASSPSAGGAAERSGPTRRRPVRVGRPVPVPLSEAGTVTDRRAIAAAQAEGRAPGPAPRPSKSSPKGRMPRTRQQVNRDVAHRASPPPPAAGHPDTEVVTVPRKPGPAPSSAPAPWRWLIGGALFLVGVTGAALGLRGTGKPDPAPVAARTRAAPLLEAERSPAPADETTKAPSSPAGTAPGPPTAEPAEPRADPDADAARSPARDAPAEALAARGIAKRSGASASRPGKVSVTSTPAGAKVYLNRRKVGITPMVVDLPRRRRRSRIALRLRGHKTWGMWVNRDRSEPVRAELKPRRRKR